MAFFSYFILGIKSIFLYTIKFIKYFLIGLFNIVIFIPKYFIIGISFIFSKKKRATIKNSENKNEAAKKMNESPYIKGSSWVSYNNKIYGHFNNTTIIL